MLPRSTAGPCLLRCSTCLLPRSTAEAMLSSMLAAMVSSRAMPAVMFYMLATTVDNQSHACFHAYRYCFQLGHASCHVLHAWYHDPQPLSCLLPRYTIVSMISSATLPEEQPKCYQDANPCQPCSGDQVDCLKPAQLHLFMFQKQPGLICSSRFLKYFKQDHRISSHCRY